MPPDDPISPTNTQPVSGSVPVPPENSFQTPPTAGQTTTPSTSPTENPSDNPAATSRKSILVIEDEPFISELYVRALTAAGYDVKVIVDGDEALRAAQTNAYDVILLDIMLPNMMGTEILRRLRDAKETPNLRAKIIITTNLELDEAGRAAIESQADGYIVKADITPKELAIFLDQLQLNT